MVKHTAMRGYLYSVAASCTFALYLVINRHVYLNYHPNSIDYVVTFMLSGMLFAFASLLSQKARARPKPKYDFGVILNGVIAGLGVGIVVFGQRFTTAINVSLLITLVILVTALFSALLTKEKLHATAMPWILTMFVGFYLAIVGLHGVPLNGGDLLILLAAVFLGFSNAYAKTLTSRNDSQFVADARITIAGIMFGIFGLIARGSFLVTNAGFWPLLAGLFFWITIKFFYGAIKIIGSNIATIISNTHPIFTAVIGTLVLGEAYSLNKFVGSVLIIISIVMINLPSHREKIEAIS